MNSTVIEEYIVHNDGTEEYIPPEIYGPGDHEKNFGGNTDSGLVKVNENNVLLFMDVRCHFNGYTNDGRVIAIWDVWINNENAPPTYKCVHKKVIAPPYMFRKVESNFFKIGDM